MSHHEAAHPLDPRDLKIDTTQQGRRFHVTVTHLPSRRVRSFSGMNPLAAKRRCVTSLTQDLLDNPPADR